MKYLILAVFIFFGSFSAISQPSDTVKCFTDVNSLPSPLYLPTNTSGEGQHLKILIIYVTFPDDNEGSATPSFSNIWPNPYLVSQGTRPINPYTSDGTLIDASKESNSTPFMRRYRQYTYSDFFCQMSQGSMDVIGDEVYFKLPEPSYHYQNIGWHASDLNAYILNYVHANLGINFEDYDNWSLDNSNGTWEFKPDGFPEMIVIQFRKIPGAYENFYWSSQGGIGGKSSLQIGSITVGNSTINAGCGITATQGINSATRVMIVPEHEICHYIFGYYFDHHGFNGGHTSIGMMEEGHGLSTFTMLPMERSMPGLDWSTPINVNSQNLQNSYTLGDFIATGNCLKVVIPNTNPEEYFWVSNHQKRSVYDGVSRGSKECTVINGYQQDPYCDKGKGLYIFSESDKDCPNNIHGFGANGYRHFAFDLISAEGKFDWETDRQVTNVPYGIGTINLQKTITGNRISGQSKFNNHYLQGGNVWSAQLINDNICSDSPNDYFVTGDFHGTGQMAYNMGYDEIFSPYSNPASNSCQNPSTNSGLTFKLLSQNSQTGTISLKIYYNNTAALSALPPSKPKNLKCTKEIDGDFFHPKITWDANIEPDFANSNGHYKVYRGANYNCDVEPSYGIVATLTYNTTEYIDESVSLFDKQQGIGNCGNDLVTYSYKISAIDENYDESLKSERALVSGYMEPCLIEDPGSRPGHGSDIETPKKFNLGNYPNPFNPVTNISYSLPKSGLVSIKVYDMVGRMVKELVNEYKDIGTYSVTFDGSDFASGIYFYRIQTRDFVNTKRMVLVK